MNIVNKVKIGGIVYGVEQPFLIDNNPDVDGQIDYRNQLIALKSDMDVHSDYAKQVFLHEILHGIYEHCGFEQDEEKIKALSIALYTVITDNPNIF